MDWKDLYGVLHNTYISYLRINAMALNINAQEEADAPLLWAGNIKHIIKQVMNELRDTQAIINVLKK